MGDWSTYVVAVLTGGGGAALVPLVRVLPEWLRHRHADHDAELEAERTEPARTQAQALGAADQALVIHQRSIDALEQQVEDLKLRYSLQQQESDDKIRRLNEENRTLNNEVTRLNQHIAQLYRTMGQMAEELRMYRPAAGSSGQ